MRLRKRLAELEALANPAPPPRVLSILMYEDQTKEQAVAAYEAKHGLIGDNRNDLRVIIKKPISAPAHA